MLYYKQGACLIDCNMLVYCVRVIFVQKKDFLKHMCGSILQG